jgi:hypothetical protein
MLFAGVVLLVLGSDLGVSGWIMKRVSFFGEFGRTIPGTDHDDVSFLDT